jgi:phage-related protein
MPGSVANAAPSTVLPKFLCSAFQESREIALQANEYRNGESQRALQVSSSRRQWSLNVRLASAEMDALRTFFLARRGSLEPFYFYDPFAVTPVGSNWDGTGASATGRITVKFAGPWEQSMGIARTDVSIRLVEVN